jgi:hypothetical protein
MQMVATTTPNTAPYTLTEGQVKSGTSVQEQEVVRAYEISSHRDQYPKVTTIVRKSLDWNKQRLADSRACQVLKMRDYLRLPALKKRAREDDSLQPGQPESKHRKIDHMIPMPGEGSPSNTRSTIHGFLIPNEDISTFMTRVYLNTTAALLELSYQDIREYFENQLFFLLPSQEEIVTMSHSAVFRTMLNLHQVIQCATSHIPLDIRVTHPALQWHSKMIISSSENCRRWIEDHRDSIKQQYTQIARAAIQNAGIH